MGAYPYSSMPIPNLLSFQDGGDVNTDPFPLTPGAFASAFGGGAGDPTTLPDAYGAPFGGLSLAPSAYGQGRYHVVAPTKYHGWLMVDSVTGGTRGLTADEIASVTGGGGGAGGSTAQPNYHLDPRELQLEYDKLYEDQIKAGQTEEDARRSALASLLNNRNTESVALANAYGNIADKAAAFAAKPQDAVAELMYRNATLGQQGTPFGSTASPQFGQYGNALADKFQQMFGPAAQALSRAGQFIGSVPPSDYLSPETRQQLGLNPNEMLPTPQWTNGNPMGATGGGSPSADQASAPAAAPAGAGAAPDQNPLAGFVGANPAQLNAINQIAGKPPGSMAIPGAGPMPGADSGGVINSMFGVPMFGLGGGAQGGAVTAQPYGMSAATGMPNTQAGLTGMADGGLASFLPVSMALGGHMFGTGTDIGFSKFGTVSSQPGYAYGGTVRAPAMPAEGGLALNLAEPAKIVGIHSGHVYATVAEPRPDGTPRPERLEIKPLASEKAKDKQLQAMHKQTAQTPQQTLAGGGQMPGMNQMGSQGQPQSLGMPQGAQGGGDITFGTDPSQFMDQLRSTLGRLGAPSAQPGQALPDPRLTAGDVYTKLQRDPRLNEYVGAGYAAQGVPNYQDTVNRFVPNVSRIDPFYRTQVSFT